MLVVEPAAKSSTADLARIMTRAYEDYLMPVRMDAPSFEAFCRERDVDLARSRVAFQDTRPVGLATVAIRERAGYLAAIGLAPEARGRGFSRTLLDEALSSLAAGGAVSCVLEVLEENAVARRLYAGAGFRETRRLPCYRTRSLVGRNLDVKEVSLASLRPRSRLDAPWPNAFRSAERALARGYASSAGYAVARPSPRGVVVYDVGGDDPGAVVDGLGALHSGEPATYVNVADERVEDALQRRGWVRYAGQLEMRRALK